LACAALGWCGCGGTGSPTPSTPTPAATPAPSTSIVEAEFDNNDTLANSFTLVALLPASARIVRATWDLTTSQRRAYFDTCLEPPGVASTHPFTPLNGSEVGLTTVFGACALNGEQTLTLEFQHFDGGEQFRFQIDTEDATDQVYVTGANFAGSTVSVTVLASGSERRLTGSFQATGERTARATITEN
jgi:hypothetical protein